MTIIRGHLSSEKQQGIAIFLIFLPIRLELPERAPNPLFHSIPPPPPSLSSPSHYSSILSLRFLVPPSPSSPPAAPPPLSSPPLPLSLLPNQPFHLNLAALNTSHIGDSPRKTASFPVNPFCFSRMVICYSLIKFVVSHVGIPALASNSQKETVSSVAPLLTSLPRFRRAPTKVNHPFRWFFISIKLLIIFF